MGLEAATYINQLNPLNPVGAVDPKSQGDDHIRMIKAAIQASFPNITGAMTATQAQLNAVGASGITGFAVAANKVKGNTAAGAGVATTALRSDVTMQLDLADAFSWTGQHTWTQPLRGALGGSAAPTFSFTADTNTGMYGAGAGDLRFAVAGNLALQIQPTFFAPLIQIQNIFGSAGAPSYSFFNDTNTGMYRANADDLRLVAGGIFIAGFQIDGSSRPLVYVADGVAAQPAFCFGSDTDTGLFRVGNDQIGIAANGVRVLHIVAAAVSGMTVRLDAGQFGVPDGSTGAPAYSFTTDPDTGLYRIGANQLGFAEGGAGYRIGFRSVPRSTTATTLVSEDNGKCVAVTAAINIPASTFSAGDCLSIYNDSAASVNLTISAGTLRLAGTTSTGTRVIGPRGMATIWFNTGGATPEVICSGAGVS